MEGDWAGVRVGGVQGEWGLFTREPACTPGEGGWKGGSAGETERAR